MSGQVIPKGDRKWLVRWYVGRDAQNKRVYNSETVNGTHAQAQQALRKKLSAKDSGVLTATSKETLCQYLTGLPTLKDVQASKDPLTGWLASRVSISPKTRRDYQTRIVADILPTLGHHRLDKLTKDACQHLVTVLQTEKGHSPRTIQYTLQVLTQALSHAVRDGKIGKNPAAFVECPKMTKTRTMQTLTVAEQQRLLRCHAIPLERRARWCVALLSGMRPQEYLALQWPDVDWTHSILSVVRALVEVTPGHWVSGPTKTKHSVRRLPVPQDVLTLLQDHRRAQAAFILQQGDRYTRNDLVFAGRTGQPFDLSAVRRQWKADCATAGVPVVPLYATRHTHLTTLLEANVHPKVAQERGGHSSIRTTLDIYSHVVTSMQQDASDTVGSLLFGHAPSPQNPPGPDGPAVPVVSRGHPAGPQRRSAGQ
jgi:integrase